MPTYYVRSTDGDDGDTGLSVALAWATLQKAFDTAVAGDTVLICNDGTHTPAATVDVDTNAGTDGHSGLIRFRGCAADGTDDGTKATISGASAAYLFKDGVTNNQVDFVSWENLILDGATYELIYCGYRQHGLRLLNCELKNAGRDGVRLKTYGDLALVNCNIHSNTGAGLGQTGPDSGWYTLFNCDVHDNGSHGVSAGYLMNLHCCRVYDNGGHGLHAYGYQIKAACYNSVVYGNTGSGVYFGDATITNLWDSGNNIFHSNGGWGVNLNNVACGGASGPNVYYLNTSGAATTDNSTDEAAVVDMVGTPITANPVFASLVDGSEDFAIGLGGSAFQAGLPGTTPAGVGTGYISLGSLIPDEADVGVSEGVAGRNLGLLPVTKTSEIT